MKRTGEKKQIVYAVLTVFLWATMAPAVKLMQDSVPTTEVLFLAGVFSVVFLLGRLIANGKVKEYRTFGAQNYKVVLGLGFLGFFVYANAGKITFSEHYSAMTFLEFLQICFDL